MKHFKRALYVFGNYIIFAIVSLIIVTTIFPFALKNDIASYICTALTTLIAWGSMYGTAWHNGKSDWRFINSETKRNPEFTCTFKPYCGFFTALPFTVVNAALAILAFSGGAVFTVIFRALNSCFLGFMLDSENNLFPAGAALAVILPLVVYSVGYVVGKYDFSISEKYLQWLVYKKPKDKAKK